MMGRKTIYKPETLKIGDKMELRGKAKKYAHQYVRQFNNRVNGNGERFRHVSHEGKSFIERIS